MTGAHEGNDIIAKHNSLESRLEDLKAACDDHVESVKRLVAAIGAQDTISDPELVQNWTRIVMLETDTIVVLADAMAKMLDGRSAGQAPAEGGGHDD